MPDPQPHVGPIQPGSCASSDSSADLCAATTLDQIPSGQLVRVLGVEGVDAIARRLGELGVRTGIEIEILQRAPLGDPTLFELCGYQLCLRRSESARIRVERIRDAAG
jgi:ferrous iron transport protein A